MTTTQHDRNHHADPAGETAYRISHQHPGVHKIPRWNTATSLLGLGPIPFTQLINTHTLVAEANRLTRAGDNGLTQTETAVRARPNRRARRYLDHQLKQTIEPMIRTIKALHAEINQIDQVLAQLPDTAMLGPTGEKLNPAEADHNQSMLRERIAADTREGSVKHLIAPRHRIRDLLLLGLDYPVFLYAMFGLLNIDPRLIAAQPANLLMAGIAGLFALLGTILVAVIMRRMGRRHRAFKDDQGSLIANTGKLKAERIGVIAVISTAATVMGARLFTEAAAADIQQLITAIPLAILFAVLIAFSCHINYHAEFDNGSTSTDHLQHLSAQIRGREHQIHTFQNLRQLKVEQAGVATAKLTRAIADARSKADALITDSTADKAINLARSYTRNSTVLPAPALDHSRFELATRQTTELTEHQRHLQTSKPQIPQLDEDLFTYLQEH